MRAQPVSDGFGGGRVWVISDFAKKEVFPA
jgi:hypothetical protein